MSGTKAKELDNTRDNKAARAGCSICNPRKDEIPMWKVWEWSKRNPGKSWRKAHGS